MDEECSGPSSPSPYYQSESKVDQSSEFNRVEHQIPNDDNHSDKNQSPSYDSCESFWLKIKTEDEDDEEDTNASVIEEVTWGNEMGQIRSCIKTRACKTTATTCTEEDGDETVGGLINSEGEEVEWSPNSPGSTPNVTWTGEKKPKKSRGMKLLSCKVCERDFKSKSALYRHQKAHTGNRHECAHCGKRFPYLHKLQRHQRTHTKEKPYVCLVCEKGFPRMDRLNEHKKRHQQTQKPFSCSVCGKGYTRLARLKVHEKTHRGRSAKAKTRKGLAEDEKKEASGLIHLDGEELEWDSAGHTPNVDLSDNESLSGSNKLGRPGKRKQRLKNEEAQKLFSCASCDKQFQSRFTRDRHMREKHGTDLSHKCSECGETFRIQRSLIAHQRIYHRPSGVHVEPQGDPRPPKIYLCSTCGKEFASSGALNRHLLIHSGAKPYKCSVCGRGFTQIGNLRTHLKIHKDVETTNTSVAEMEVIPKPVETEPSIEICSCRVCGTQFTEKSLLEEHQAKVHDHNKPHSCPDCGKKFLYVHKLKAHQLGHQGLKPFQCSQCDRCFQSSMGLENHMRDHTGEKPFPCSVCGKRFKQASTLRNHFMIHTGDRPHLCSICGKSYVRAEELKVHIRVHTGEKPYQCDECGKSFYYRQGLNNHQKIHNAKPIGPTRQLGRPRQLDRPRKISKPRKMKKRAIPDSDGEDFSWDPPKLGDSPNHLHGNQENIIASDPNQSCQWNLGTYSAFNPWSQHRNAPCWRGAECQQSYYVPPGPSMSFSVLLKDTMVSEQGSYQVERPSQSSGPPQVPVSSGFGQASPQPYVNTPHQRTDSPKADGKACHEGHKASAQKKSRSGEICEERLSSEGSSTSSDTAEKLREKQTQENLLQTGCKAKKIYNCPTCGKVLAHNTALQRHLLIHTGKRPFKCSICGKGFNQKGNLKTHLKVHRGETPSVDIAEEEIPPTTREPPVTTHLCGECGMDFPQQQQLEDHQNIHNEKKPYRCPDCGRRFNNERYVKIHQRMHTGDSPFLCSKCGKTFVTLDGLKKHEPTHTGEKNFHCNQCGRSFTQSSHLKEHLKTHSGEKAHLCTICGKSYFNAYDLKVHLRVHTGETPYKCDTCGKCFYYSQGYRAHLKTHVRKPNRTTKPLGRPKQLQAIDQL